MGSEYVVVRDDVSWAGLRRRHVLCARPVEAEGLAAEAVGEAVGGVFRLAWQDDETRMYHVYLAWRCAMEEMWVVTFGGKLSVSGDRLSVGLVEAVGRAAVGYERRYGRWPTHGRVRAGTLTAKGGCEAVELVGQGGRAVGEVRLVEVGWMPRGAVGVYRQEGNQAPSQSGTQAQVAEEEMRDE